MRCALSHPPSRPSHVASAQMTAADIALICGMQWVWEWFFMTDVNVQRWSGRSYGNVRLVDRRMVISWEREGNGGWGLSECCLWAGVVNTGCLSMLCCLHCLCRTLLPHPYHHRHHHWCPGRRSLSFSAFATPIWSHSLRTPQCARGRWKVWPSTCTIRRWTAHC